MAMSKYSTGRLPTFSSLTSTTLSSPKSKEAEVAEDDEDDGDDDDDDDDDEDKGTNNEDVLNFTVSTNRGSSSTTSISSTRARCAADEAYM
mmetsp:Transcript_39142/g.76959  ORF Transcript_39142/g.76959 Transcript_39142/m.76959 type:complete len:91 (-) Transcript_39142:26-298(-)